MKVKKCYLFVILLLLVGCNKSEDACNPLEEPSKTLKITQVDVTISECDGQIDYAHQSRDENEFVKVKAVLECEAPEGQQEVALRAWVELDMRQSDGKIVQVASGQRTTKVLGSKPINWTNKETFVISSCEPGYYRGRLRVELIEPGQPVMTFGDFITGDFRYVGCDQYTIGLVIDDTSSMSRQIGGLKTSLTNYINSRVEDDYVLWGLTVFKDNARGYGTTLERKEVLNWVNGIEVDGGEDCPEDILGAIKFTVGVLRAFPNNRKEIIVVTDASAQPGNVDGLIATLKAEGIRVSTMLAGNDCEDVDVSSSNKETNSNDSLSQLAEEPSLSSKILLKRIAEETGGKYRFIPEGRLSDYESAFDEIFKEVEVPNTQTCN